MLKRLIILGLIIGGAYWFISQDVEEKGKAVEEEVVVSEEIDVAETENLEVKTEKVETASSISVIPQKAPTKRVSFTNKTDIKVFLYEWGIDFSSAEIPVGNISFAVQNNGKFSHNFSIGGVRDFGKVVPGETKIFNVTLRAGSFEAYSDKRDDYEKNVRQAFQVVR